MAELRAAHYSLNQQTQKVSGSQESSITEKEKKSTMLGEKRKKKGWISPAHLPEFWFSTARFKGPWFACQTGITWLPWPGKNTASILNILSKEPLTYRLSANNEWHSLWAHQKPSLNLRFQFLSLPSTLSHEQSRAEQTGDSVYHS